MSVFIAPIVEGHAEVKAVERLLHRVWNEIVGCPNRLVVLTPFRPKRDQLLKPDGVVLGGEVQITFLKVQAKTKREPGSTGLVLLLLDAEKECPARLAPRLLQAAMKARADAMISCVLAKKMFENWLVAGAATLHGVNGLPNPLTVPSAVEALGGKSWFEQQLRSVDKTRAYSETIDCPEFVREMDIVAARQSSESFDKLCRELDKLLPPAVPPTPPDPGGTTP